MAATATPRQCCESSPQQERRRCFARQRRARSDRAFDQVGLHVQVPFQLGHQNLGKVPPPGVWTLPRAFKESRYRTAAFSSNGVVDGPGFAGGFDTFWSATGVTMYREFLCLYNLLSNHDFWHMHEVLDRFTLAKVRGETVRKLARSWIARHRDGPFFLYLHVNEPHWPYEKHGHKLVPSARGAEPLSTRICFPGASPREPPNSCAARQLWPR